MARSTSGPKASGKGALGQPLEYPWPKALLCLQGSLCCVGVMLTITFTPQWQGPAQCWVRPSGRGCELPTLCSCSSSVWRECALSPSSSCTPCWLRVMSPPLGSHKQPLAGSQACPSECPLLIPAVFGGFSMPGTSILWLLLRPQDLLSTHFAS